MPDCVESSCVSLNIAAQSKQFIDEKMNLQQININNERLISIKQSQIINQKEALTPQEQTYEDTMLRFGVRSSALEI